MNVLEKILEEIEHEIMTNREIGRKQSEGMARAMNIIRSHMDDGKDTNVPSNWIPCSERLPSEEEFIKAYCRNSYAAEFLVTIKGATRPTTLYFKNNSWFDEGRNYYKVVAWQPLPAPYKGEEAQVNEQRRL